ncbi:keratin-associated protein 22-1 [Chlorocebus sabaeus]|uniref:Keratin associated protein 22-1 n=1 Tax=Chlorocebus sabaeus TaxID=60711 RepID=A0A0D9SBH8_CHLSB|nr:keratin-associated protein 22-1 [Chlorocebus sabaeus]
MSFYNNFHCGQGYAKGGLGCSYGCGHSGYGYAFYCPWCYERSWFSGCF